jgi:hypothetical protein
VAHTRKLMKKLIAGVALVTALAIPSAALADGVVVGDSTSSMTTGNTAEQLIANHVARSNQRYTTNAVQYATSWFEASIFSHRVTVDDWYYETGGWGRTATLDRLLGLAQECDDTGKCPTMGAVDNTLAPFPLASTVTAG